MTDTTDLDLSVLAKVAPPEQDEKPQVSRQDNDLTRPERAPSGKPTDEAPPPKPRRRMSRPGAGTAPVPPQPEEQPRSRNFVRDDDILLPDYSPGMFVKPLTDAYRTIGMMVMPLSEPIGTVIMQNAEPCAKSIDNAAKLDKKFRAYLLRAMGTGAWIPVLIAHMPIIMVVAVVLFPGKRLPALNPDGVPLTDQTGETVNPVSNGFRRPR